MRNYKRKTNRGQTPHDVMERAADAVSGGQSVRSAAKDFAIDRMTLKRYIGKRDRQQGTAYAPVALRHLVFSPDMEKDLGNHVKQLADMFHGLSLNRCCTLAYEFAKRNNVDVPASWDREKKAGQDWWSGFKKRQNLAIRQPEATSFGRATAFNRPVVDKFFNNLAQAMIEKLTFPGWLQTRGLRPETAQAIVTDLDIKSRDALEACTESVLLRTELLSQAKQKFPFAIYAEIHRFMESCVKPRGDVQPTASSLVCIFRAMLEPASQEFHSCAQKLRLLKSSFTRAGVGNVQMPSTSSAHETKIHDNRNRKRNNNRVNPNSGNEDPDDMGNSSDEESDYSNDEDPDFTVNGSGSSSETENIVVNQDTTQTVTGISATLRP
uniref:uncharacterized protein isoform X4 n=1 Tax=Myxine glutinosa TaxID=7769 RepID=UPI00358F7108